MVQSETTRTGGDRRTEILRQAAQVFREKGYHGAGMREIAAGIGVAPGALYYYFESKEDLLYACQDVSLRRLIEVAETLVADRASPADVRLRRLIAAHLDLTLDELGGSAAHVEFHALPRDRLSDIVGKRDRYERLIRQVIEDGVREGAFRPVDVKLSPLALLGALNWTVVWWRPGGRWTSQDLVAGTTDLFLSGLLADSAHRTTEGA